MVCIKGTAALSPSDVTRFCLVQRRLARRREADVWSSRRSEVGRHCVVARNTMYLWQEDERIIPDHAPLATHLQRRRRGRRGNGIDATTVCQERHDAKSAEEAEMHTRVSLPLPVHDCALRPLKQESFVQYLAYEVECRQTTFHTTHVPFDDTGCLSNMSRWTANGIERTSKHVSARQLQDTARDSQRGCVHVTCQTDRRRRSGSDNLQR